METTISSAANNRYFMLESSIPYDNDDYGVWANIVFDSLEKSIIIDYYGHGSKSKYGDIASEDFTSMNIDDCYNTIYKKLNLSAGIISGMIDNTDINHINCVVNKGRKLKGNLIFVKEITERKVTSWKTFSETFAIVADIQSKRFCRVKPEYIEIDKSCINDTNIKKAILNKGIRWFAHMIAYNISYASCDTENYYYNLKCIANECMKDMLYNDIINLYDFTDIDKENHEKRIKPKNDKLWEEKKDDLLTWAKSKLPNGNETEIEELAKRVFDKYYKK